MNINVDRGAEKRALATRPGEIVANKFRFVRRLRMNRVGHVHSARLPFIVDKFIVKVDDICSYQSDQEARCFQRTLLTHPT